MRLKEAFVRVTGIKNRNILSHIRRSFLFLLDALCFIAVDVAYFLTASLVTEGFSDCASQYIRASVAVFMAIFAMRMIFRTYHSMWRYSDTYAYLKLVFCDGLGGVMALGLILIMSHSTWYGIIIPQISVIALTNLMTLCMRFVYRLVYKHHHYMAELKNSNKSYTNIAIVGAGQLGVTLVNSLRYSAKSLYHPVCFIDIDPIKIGKRVSDLSVYGGSDPNLSALLEKNAVREIVVAINKLDQTQADYLLHHYGDMGYNVKLYDAPILENNRRASDYVIREFQIEDLLFRKPVQYLQSLNYYMDKTILVTGGGGSIGSELCRRIAACKPGRLIIFDIYENNAYEIQQELLQTYGSDLNLIVEIGSVRDRARLEYLFRTYRPAVVFHAAAHKHVPLMEQSSCEAIKNNIFGTYNTADMAEKYGTDRFILISTDKAVNPTNVMGASKRMCEMIIQCRGDSQTRFAAVRFGNVLGSNGSVIPLFKKQIKSGGPVTITDKRIVRYFMTIPEASQLVLQAGTMAKRGELFVLDMGEPVKIYELAKKMIRLCGLEPGRDIEVKEIGLRPGEKLYEELLIKSESCVKTTDDKIFIEHDTPLTREEIEAHLALLRRAVAAVENGGGDSIRDTLMGIVPTFRDPDVVNSQGVLLEEAPLCTAPL